ncbi:hypothetical protein [Nonomuraea sp. NPDC049028]|uniref:hypothetical protein n=1 Tax=Nonomuraea sp. NPDC049028 TaxID=3364348 RepID=UPI00371B4DC3
MATSETTVGARHWLRGGDAVMATALAMIAVQLVWKSGLVRRTYFRQDDFTFIARGLEHDLTWDYLMRVDYGHLVPGPFAIQWAMGRLGVYNDVLAHVVTVTLLGTAGLALLRLLRLLFGARPAILVPLGFYLLTPMTISSLSWWAVVIETLPFQIALPMALCSHVLYTRTGRFRHALAAAGWTLFAMAFFVKAPFILLLAVALSMGWLGWSRRRQWPALLLYAGLLAGYAAVFFRQLLTSVQLTNDTIQPSLPDAGLAAKFAWTLLSSSLVPTSLGGPWQWRPIGEDYAMAGTPPSLVWAGLGVAVVVLAVSVLFRRRAWLAWLVLLAYFALADVVPVMIGRIQQLGPDLSGAELRYVSSTATVVAIAIGLAFIPLAGEERPWLRAWPRLRFAWLPLAAAVALGSVWSVAAYARLPFGADVKSYVETGRLALKRAPEHAVVLDTHVPAKVVYPIFFYDYALASKVLGPIAPHPVTWTRRLSGPVRNPLTFDPQGRLRPVSIDGLTIPQPAGCKPVGAREVRFRLPARLPEGEWTVQVGYLNPAATRLSVRLGTGRDEVVAEKGFGWTFAAVKGGGTELVIRTANGPDACLGEIKIGIPRPWADGTPSPLQPVTP